MTSQDQVSNQLYFSSYMFLNSTERLPIRTEDLDREIGRSCFKVESAQVILAPKGAGLLRGGSRLWNPLFNQRLNLKVESEISQRDIVLYAITNTLRLSIYTSMNTFPYFSSWMLLDTLSDVLDKCLCFSLIKLESVQFLLCCTHFY